MIELEQIQRSLKQCADSQPLMAYWDDALFTPLSDLFARPKKEFRAQMVHIGFDLAKGQSNQDTQHNLQLLAQIIEAIHSGSLIVDDIEDGSEVRRGAPTLHLIYGLPKALNAGNWLYFFAFHLIGKLKIDANTKILLFENISEALLAAHYGQALDVGAPMDQVNPEHIPMICQKSLELKSGVLMGLAMQLGALLAGADLARTKQIYRFGVDFGVCLQRFDDIGNLNTDKPTAKHLEDLILKRPSWVWSYLYSNRSSQEQEEFKLALQKLPQISALSDFLAKTGFRQACFQEARAQLEILLATLKQNFELADHSDVYVQIQRLGDKLTYAYK